MFTLEKIHYNFERYLFSKYNKNSLQEINKKISLIKIDEWDADYLKVTATLCISGELNLQDKKLSIKDTVYLTNGLKELLHYKQINLYLEMNSDYEFARISLNNDNLFTRVLFADLYPIYEELVIKVRNQIIYYNSLIKKHNEELEQSQKENQENKEEN